MNLQKHARNSEPLSGRKGFSTSRTLAAGERRQTAVMKVPGYARRLATFFVRCPASKPAFQQPRALRRRFGALTLACSYLSQIKARSVCLAAKRTQQTSPYAASGHVRAKGQTCDATISLSSSTFKERDIASLRSLKARDSVTCFI